MCQFILLSSSACANQTSHSDVALLPIWWSCLGVAMEIFSFLLVNEVDSFSHIGLLLAALFYNEPVEVFVTFPIGLSFFWKHQYWTREIILRTKNWDYNVMAAVHYALLKVMILNDYLCVGGVRGWRVEEGGARKHLLMWTYWYVWTNERESWAF